MFGLVLAFKEFRLSAGILGSEWSGLENFSRLFGGADFPNALRNTVTISLLRLLFGFFAPIVLALMLNEIRVSWYKRTVQTVTYIPYFLSWVILGGIFLMIFSQSGPANQISQLFGISPIEFLTNDFWFNRRGHCHRDLAGGWLWGGDLFGSLGWDFPRSVRGGRRRWGRALEADFAHHHPRAGADDYHAFHPQSSATCSTLASTRFTTCTIPWCTTQPTSSTLTSCGESC